MNFGDLSSVLQLAAGLNTAYFSFSELRQPVVSSERRALAELKQVIDERSEVARLTTLYQEELEQHLQLVVDLDTIQFRYQRIDRFAARLCLVMSIAYILLLIAAAILASEPVPFPKTAIVVSVLGYLPISLCLLTSVVAMQHIYRNVSERRRTLELAVLSRPVRPTLEADESPSREGDLPR